MKRFVAAISLGVFFLAFALPVWGDEAAEVGGESLAFTNMTVPDRVVFIAIEGSDGVKGELIEKDGQIHFEGNASEAAWTFFGYLAGYMKVMQCKVPLSVVGE